MSNISIVIITYNEEEALENTIKIARRLSDDVIVVDSFSTDKTIDIARFYGAKIFQRKWEGYSKQKNFGNRQAINDYVLSLDADEVMSEALIKSIRGIMDAPNHDAYKFVRTNIFFGKKIKYGSNKKENVIRLFNKNKITWNGDLVHEGLELNGASVGQLEGELLHYTAKDTNDYLIKSNKYSTLFAEQQYRKNKKPNFIKIYLSPIYTFIREYIFKLGLLDGFEGYFLARQSANYCFLKYAKLKMMYRMNGQ
ncbi:MAG TPA: glycosyltransferase family 2 protein [Cytophagales bacterium]|nr:glycosyltransferase family 2 protein [Cytophagales bacterium]